MVVVSGGGVGTQHSTEYRGMVLCVVHVAGLAQVQICGRVEAYRLEVALREK